MRMIRCSTRAWALAPPPAPPLRPSIRASANTTGPPTFEAPIKPHGHEGRYHLKRGAHLPDGDSLRIGRQRRVAQSVIVVLEGSASQP